MSRTRFVWLGLFCAVALVAGLAISSQVAGEDEASEFVPIEPAPGGNFSCAADEGVEEAIATFDEGSQVKREATPKDELTRVLSGTRLGANIERYLGAWELTTPPGFVEDAATPAWDLNASEALDGLSDSSDPSEVRLEISLVDPEREGVAGVARYQLAQDGWQLRYWAMCSSLITGNKPVTLSDEEIERLREEDRLNHEKEFGEN